MAWKKKKMKYSEMTQAEPRLEFKWKKDVLWLENCRLNKILVKGYYNWIMGRKTVSKCAKTELHWIVLNLGVKYIYKCERKNLYSI